MLRSWQSTGEGSRTNTSFYWRDYQPERARLTSTSFYWRDYQPERADYCIRAITSRSEVDWPPGTRVRVRPLAVSAARS
jgi:hypothetical protein